MYFKQFPKIYYDFNLKDNDKTLKILTDITTNVRVRKQILEKISLYDEYDIQEGETPELIAEKFYGNPEYHWIIMLLNERYDHINDFPIHQNELDEHISSIYGSDKMYNIHHYEKNGIFVEAKMFLKVPLDKLFPQNLFKVNDYLLTDSIVSRIESIDIANNRLLLSIQKGSFKAGESIEVRGFRYNEEKQVDEYTLAFTFIVPQNPVEMIDTYVAVSNYDYEISLNEKKRRIKILAPELLAQILQEFTDLVV